MQLVKWHLSPSACLLGSAVSSSPFETLSPRYSSMSRSFPTSDQNSGQAQRIHFIVSAKYVLLQWQREALAAVPGILGTSNQVSVFLKQLAFAALLLFQCFGGSSWRRPNLDRIVIQSHMHKVT